MENFRGKVCDVNISRRDFCMSDQSQNANANWVDKKREEKIKSTHSSMKRKGLLQFSLLPLKSI